MRDRQLSCRYLPDDRRVRIGQEPTLSCRRVARNAGGKANIADSARREKGHRVSAVQRRPQRCISQSTGTGSCLRMSCQLASTTGQASNVNMSNAQSGTRPPKVSPALVVLKSTQSRPLSLFSAADFNPRKQQCDRNIRQHALSSSHHHSWRCGARRPGVRSCWRNHHHHCRGSTDPAPLETRRSPQPCNEPEIQSTALAPLSYA